MHIIKRLNDIELQIYFLKLEGNSLMFRQILKNLQSKIKKCKNSIKNKLSNIEYHVHRN
jgi:hypothetical protein